MNDDFSLPQDIRHAFGLENAPCIPLPGDASSRRYARTEHPVHGPCLLLFDTPETPHFLNFLQVANHLARLGFSAPRVFDVAESDGIALIEDFGDTTYTDLLHSGADEPELYELATETLIDLHKQPTATAISVPPYDMTRLLDETALFTDWFAPAHGEALSDATHETHRSLWRRALTRAAQARDALVLRDFHVDNLMLLQGREGVRACGLLDFQDALIGSRAYDLVSLTQDARRDVSPALEARCLDLYLEAFDTMDRAFFLQEYHLLGAQRHTKVAGIFHRLAARDGKPHYLSHVPRVLRLMVRELEASGLTDLIAFYDTHVPSWRI